MGRKRYSKFRLSHSENYIILLMFVLVAAAVALKILQFICVFVYDNWEVFTVLGIIALIVLKSRKKSNAVNGLSLDDIDSLTPRGFELFLGDLFKARGYKVTVTPLSGDKGADVIIEKDGRRTAIQAKLYSDNVDHKGVQEVYGSLNYYKCQKGIVVTNRYFRGTAKTLAKMNNIELWDRDRLASEIRCHSEQLGR